MLHRSSARAKKNAAHFPFRRQHQRHRHRPGQWQHGFTRSRPSTRTRSITPGPPAGRPATSTPAVAEPSPIRPPEPSTPNFDGSFSYNQGGALSQFNNAGTFNKSGGFGRRKWAASIFHLPSSTCRAPLQNELYAGFNGTRLHRQVEVCAGDDEAQAG
jgi:hypothetical protein